jgi:hypothetical protein
LLNVPDDLAELAPAEADVDTDEFTDAATAVAA